MAVPKSKVGIDVLPPTLPPDLPNRRHQKRKISQQQTAEDVDTSKPSAIFTPKGPRLYTVTIALPGSIIEKYD
jgi:hypothetical protein